MCSFCVEGRFLRKHAAGSRRLLTPSQVYFESYELRETKLLHLIFNNIMIDKKGQM